MIHKAKTEVLSGVCNYIDDLLIRLNLLQLEVMYMNNKTNVGEPVGQ